MAVKFWFWFFFLAQIIVAVSAFYEILFCFDDFPESSKLEI